MKRLRERTDPMSPLELDAITLLSATERFQPPTGAKQRVRASLLASRAGARVRAFRPVVILVSLLLAAGASAAIGGTWIIEHRLRSETTVPSATETPANPQNARQTAVASRSLKAQEVSQAEPAVVPQASATAESLASTHLATNDKQPGPSRTQAKSSEQVKLVFDSMRALRRDAQPERAGKLLDEYLRRYPRGALAEEALALSIEAAIQRGDPRAKDLANRYLARYPSGQFQKAAERARARFSP